MSESISLYWAEFATIAVVHFLAVASPGPDFAIVLKHSIAYGRRLAIITSIGVGVGILIHVVYSLLGIGLLIKTTPWLFDTLTYVAAAYLLWLGWQGLRAKPDVSKAGEVIAQTPISAGKAFSIGLLTNGLNPKATLFFLSVFAVVVGQGTPTSVKLLYGVYLCVATGAWFCFLSYVLGSSKVRRLIGRQGHWFDRLMGLVLVLLAGKLLLPLFERGIASLAG